MAAFAGAVRYLVASRYVQIKGVAVLGRIRPRFNHATIVAYLALFVALGGSSYSAVKISGKNIKDKSIAGKKLKNRTISKGKVKRNTLTGAQINESKLGKIPSATRADSAAAADKAKSADTASSAETAKSANTATNATLATTATNISPPEALHQVGAAGEPAFGTGWSNFSPSDRATAAFYIDREGVVHLQGQVTRTSGTNAVVFTLPASYVPALQETFPAVGNGGTFAVISVRPNGNVNFDLGDPGVLHLNGMSWRAGQ